MSYKCRCWIGRPFDTSSRPRRQVVAIKSLSNRTGPQVSISQRANRTLARYSLLRCSHLSRGHSCSLLGDVGTGLELYGHLRRSIFARNRGLRAIPLATPRNARQGIILVTISAQKTGSNNIQTLSIKSRMSILRTPFAPGLKER